ncbi:MAG: efflux RND transporter periplasmic adaptor subunit [Verrucomicrobiales bacterium]|nr:efflux RND transporter periplasmic adaptor subunit [Verrucomicrobiales bacterium]
MKNPRVLLWKQSFRHKPLALLALIGCAAWLVGGCGRQAKTPGAEPSLPVATVRVQTIDDQPRALTEEIVGTVRARTRATLEAKIAGRITELPVVLGQSLEAGDLVARLDVREIQARLDQARAVLEQARRDRDRFATLLRQQAVTQAEFDGVEARFRVAEAAVAEAETMLGYAEVRAPFDGAVTRKLADVGDLATPGRPLIELEDPNALRLEADVPEALINHVQPGAKLPVRIHAANAELEGVVAEMAPAADPNSRTFRVKLDLPGAPGLKPGLFGRVAVPVGETRAPRVPPQALVQRGQMEMVFVVADGRAQMRLVKSGKRLGEEVELVSGVRPGERVVVEGAGALMDGQPVEVR